MYTQKSAIYTHNTLRIHSEYTQNTLKIHPEYTQKELLMYTQKNAMYTQTSPQYNHSSPHDGAVGIGIGFTPVARSNLLPWKVSDSPNFSWEFFFPNSVLLCSFLWAVEWIHKGYHEGLRETPSYHEGLREV